MGRRDTRRIRNGMLFGNNGGPSERDDWGNEARVRDERHPVTHVVTTVCHDSAPTHAPCIRQNGNMVIAESPGGTFSCGRRNNLAATEEEMGLFRQKR